jgi:hypothetical protein
MSHHVSTEKRLARTLLLLARYGEPEASHRALPKVSQEVRKLGASCSATDLRKVARGGPSVADPAALDRDVSDA